MSSVSFQYSIPVQLQWESPLAVVSATQLADQ
jgi:hypothetical protein